MKLSSLSIIESTAQLNPNNIPRGTHNVPREKLDFRKLNRKAVKITHPSGNLEEEGFSVVTPWNRESWNWPIKPSAEKLVMDKDLLNSEYNGLPVLDDSKYLQIITSSDDTKAIGQYWLMKLSQLNEEQIQELDLKKWAQKAALAGALVLPSIGQAQETNPFKAEKPQYTTQELMQVLSQFAGKDINKLVNSHKKDRPTLTPEGWKWASKFYKGTNRAGYVPDPNRIGHWVAPNDGSMEVRSKTKISNDEIEQDDTHITPIDRTGRRGKTTYNYGGNLGKQKVSGTNIRQIIPSRE
jgi:hypothetical protein